MWITLKRLLVGLCFFFFFLLQDWIDIDFGIAEGVDFVAISFVRTAEVIKHLKSYIRARSPNGYVWLTLLSLLITCCTSQLIIICLTSLSQYKYSLQFCSDL
jgi:hypothetical protein